MVDTTPSSSERTSSGARFRGAPSPPLPPRERPERLVQARELGSELAGALRDSAAALLDEQKTRAAIEIAALGEALHRSVQNLDRRGGGTVARHTEGAARQISQFADRLSHRSLEELSGNIEDFARRLPIAFIVSAIGIGVIAGRLLASSASRPAEQHPGGHDTAGQRTPQSFPRQTVRIGEEPPSDTWHDDAVIDAIASGSANGAASAGPPRGEGTRYVQG